MTHVSIEVAAAYLRGLMQRNQDAALSGNPDGGALLRMEESVSHVNWKNTEASLKAIHC